MVPSVSVSSPEINRNSVLLPQPEGPTSTINSPSLIERLMSWRTAGGVSFDASFLEASGGKTLVMFCRRTFAKGLVFFVFGEIGSEEFGDDFGAAWGDDAIAGLTTTLQRDIING